MTFRALAPVKDTYKGHVPAADIGARPELVWLPPDLLVVDETYQRPITEKGRQAILKIVAEFSWAKFTPVVVLRALGKFAIIALGSLTGEEADAAFAEAVSTTLNLTHHYLRYQGRNPGIAELRDALPSDPFLAAARQTFNAADYFKRAAKATALAAIEELEEAGRAEGLAPIDTLAQMKKAELADTAARFAVDCGWLPPQLRHPSYSLAPSDSRSASRPEGADAEEPAPSASKSPARAKKKAAA